MRKVIAVVYLSLDGVMENPAWTGPYFNGELGQLQNKWLFTSDTLLLGRITYQGMAAAWPTMTDDDGFADRINSLPKFVASTTLQHETAWNAQVLGGNVAHEVAQLKQQPGQDLLIYGSGELVRSLLPHGLIDEYRLMIFPVVVGSGKRLFTAESQASLQLLDTHTTSTGVIVASYQPATN